MTQENKRTWILHKFGNGEQHVSKVEAPTFGIALQRAHAQLLSEGYESEESAWHKEELARCNKHSRVYNKGIEMDSHIMAQLTERV